MTENELKPEVTEEVTPTEESTPPFAVDNTILVDGEPVKDEEEEDNPALDEIAENEDLYAPFFKEMEALNGKNLFEANTMFAFLTGQSPVLPELSSFTPDIDVDRVNSIFSEAVKCADGGAFAFKSLTAITMMHIKFESAYMNYKKHTKVPDEVGAKSTLDDAQSRAILLSNIIDTYQLTGITPDNFEQAHDELVPKLKAIIDKNLVDILACASKFSHDELCSALCTINNKNTDILNSSGSSEEMKEFYRARNDAASAYINTYLRGSDAIKDDFLNTVIVNPRNIKKIKHQAEEFRNKLQNAIIQMNRFKKSDSLSKINLIFDDAAVKGTTIKLFYTLCDKFGFNLNTASVFITYLNRLASKDNPKNAADLKGLFTALYICSGATDKDRANMDEINNAILRHFF